MALEVEINDAKLRRAIEIAPQILKMELGDGLDRISKGFLKRWREKRLQGPPGIYGKSARGLFGKFKRAFLVSRDIEGMGVQIWTDSEVAKLHETGGKLTNRGGGQLAVPLSDKDIFTGRAGGGKKVKKRFKNMLASRKFVPLTVNGKTFLARKKRGQKDIEPLFVLKRSVRIKARLGFYQTWDQLDNYRINILNQKIESALRKL